MREAKLIQDCIKEKPKAQRQLFDLHYDRMYRIALRYLGDQFEAEDVLLIAFNKVFRSIKQFQMRNEGSLKSWLNTIVINESLRSLNKQKMLFSSTEVSELQIDLEVPREIEKIDAEQIMQILQEMPTGYRTVFNLVAIEGYSHKEVAQKLNVTESTSRTQLNKARKHIIEKISASNHGAA